MTISGSLLALREEPPRMRIVLPCARLAAVGDNRDSGDLTGDHLFRGRDHAFLKFFFTNGGDGAGEVFFADRTITDDDNFIEARAARGERYIDRAAVTGRSTAP